MSLVPHSYTAKIERALWLLHSYESDRLDADRTYTEADIADMVAALRGSDGPNESEWTWSLDQPEVSAWRWIETWSESTLSFEIFRFHLGDVLAPNVACWRYINPPSRGER